MHDKEKIIAEYQEDFATDFNKWNEVKDTLNNLIEDFIESRNLELDPEEVEPFTYNEMCSELVSQMYLVLTEYDDITPVIFHSILEILLARKVLHALGEPISEIDKLF